MSDSMDKEENKSEIAKKEEKILEFWKENNIFEKTLAKDASKGDFVFYEGPPTANGKPGIHHLEARAFKDVIPRYKTMQGYYVRRKGGWDTHGLPVELQVEKALGLSSKKAIEEYGIAKFNRECKKSVWEYLEYWNKFTERVGFWVDQENPYVTYHNDYMESVWNVIKETDKQNLLYKDYKVVPWCPRCGTALSSHELAQGYEDVKDLSVYVKFRLKGAPSEVEGKSPSTSSGQASTFVLAWTTTPWTLPGNVALAVGEDIDYVKIKITNGAESKSSGRGRSSSGSEVRPRGDDFDSSKLEEFLVLAKERLSILGAEYEIVEEMKGKDLISLEYEPLYPFLQNTISENEKPKLSKAFKVYGADFVTTGDGTGVVHTAVMYGQDDFMLGNEIGLPKHHLVGLDGKFLSGNGFLEGRFVRDEDVAVDIIKDLAGRGLLFKKEKYEHSYPHCWRCHTALIYYARDSWYIRMSSLRDKLVKENEGINWEPAHIKEGRFGEWLREIKDWAISRERYWGTPLPVWTCDKCKKIEVIGGVEDLKSKTKKSGNKYILFRHGESESNKLHIVDSDPNKTHLTEYGREQAREGAQKIGCAIDFIFASPFLRTKETAEIVAETCGFPKEKIIIDERIKEINTGNFSGHNIEEYRAYFKNFEERFTKTPAGGENMTDVKKRVTEFLYEIESKHKNKNIIIVSHADAIWGMLAGANGYDLKKSVTIRENKDPIYFVRNAEPVELPFIPLPHNEDYELDLHKPYIDEVELVCDCSGNLVRTKEVLDVWLDSGTMPFSQDHYPFENQDLKYPADFISEAIDQTRGWFYTLHAVGILMGKGKAYKNVICLGLLLDAKGKKMSKSVGNVVDPWVMMDKYGVDALRFWMYSVNQPGESKNFDEKTVDEIVKKVFNILNNVISFYELYREKSIETGSYNKQPSNILDKWIVIKLNVLTKEVTEKLDNYKLLEPTRAIKDFINDLSTWYLRRSRERIKEGDVEAKKTLYFVLKNLAKLMAPFVPFATEDIWLKLRVEQNKESVHLTNWPSFFGVTEENNLLLEKMETVRKIVSLGLEARQKAGIKVRQPLASLKVSAKGGSASGGKSFLKLSSEYFDLIKDEVNVKEVEFTAGKRPDLKEAPVLSKSGAIGYKTQSSEVVVPRSGLEEAVVELDTVITQELKEEGQYRELLRTIQDLRKNEGLQPNDKIGVTIDTDEIGKNLIQKFESDLKKTAGIINIDFTLNDGSEVVIDGLNFKIKIQ